jgi:hypothetical protein
MVKKLEIIHAIVYREPVKKPCSDCPFRKIAGPGWLGGGSPESFIDCINHDEPLPCHQTIDYTDHGWKDKWVKQKIGSMCAGALHLQNHMCKSPRDKTFPKLGPNADVFDRALDFVRYHREALVHSWDDEEQSPEAKLLRKLFADAAKQSGKPIIEHGDKPKAKRRGV